MAKLYILKKRAQLLKKYEELEENGGTLSQLQFYFARGTFMFWKTLSVNPVSSPLYQPMYNYQSANILSTALTESVSNPIGEYPCGSLVTKHCLQFILLCIKMPKIT